MAFSDLLRRLGLRSRRQDPPQVREPGSRKERRGRDEATVGMRGSGTAPAPPPLPAQESAESAPAKPTVVAPRAPAFGAHRAPPIPEAPGQGAPQPPPRSTPFPSGAGDGGSELAATRVVEEPPPGQVVGVLVAVEGELQGAVRTVVSGGNRVGRHPECEVCLSSEWISRHHARIHHQQGGFTIEASSDKPTLVNSEPIETCPLHDGDYIKLGKTTLRFRSIL